MNCIDCSSDLAVGGQKLSIGEILICPECGVELEVVRERPLQVRLLADEESAESDAAAS